jgi:glyoxylase-like metal-dependent hydrolase (beta-lactamase superfamily II)
MPDPTLIPIRLRMTKAFLVQGERPMLIDAGYAGDEHYILPALAHRGLDPRDLSLILLTHPHSDHWGALHALREHTDAPVAVGRADADALRRGASATLRASSVLGRLATLFISDRPFTEPLEPAYEIDAEFDLAPFGVNGRAFPTPGHTPGSISVLLSGGEAIIGDLVMGGQIRHRARYPYFASDREQVRNSIRAVLDRQPKAIYVAHGGPFSPQELAQLVGKAWK